jgi:hypothetical protein
MGTISPAFQLVVALLAGAALPLITAIGEAVPGARTPVSLLARQRPPLGRPDEPDAAPPGKSAA